MSQILERYRLIAMISPLLLLAACSHAPHSADPPRLDVPAHFSNEEGGEGILDKSSRRTLPVDWWTAYGDPHLNALVRAALERNTELTIARARVDEASAATRRARASLLPSLSAGTQATRGRDYSENVAIGNDGRARCPHRGRQTCRDGFRRQQKVRAGCGGSRTSVGCHAVAGRCTATYV